MSTFTVRQCLIVVGCLMVSAIAAAGEVRTTEDFGKQWRFNLGEVPGGQDVALDDSHWRILNLPHDWSIEGAFSADNPATPGGGALPGGVGWYRKSFVVPVAEKGRLVFVEFDGIYRNSEVWINGHSLGLRPYGYSSFRYELTKYLHYGNEANLLAVRVDNSKQPNSRWYSGSGIYRSVRLVTTSTVCVDHWGIYVTTPSVSASSADVALKITMRNSSGASQTLTIKTAIVDPAGAEAATVTSSATIADGASETASQSLRVPNPVLWSVESPKMYKAVTTIVNKGGVVDRYETPFGIRTFIFDRLKGFSLNGKSMKINGVCDHHDLGCLGAAVNMRALERQLEILKGMGVNGIRTSHNPPAPELLDLCDRMGFIVMDEAFDMWKKGKNPYDYSLNWDEWHRRDLEDMVMRDRNHPSVFVWSIGNEIQEQYDHNDTSGSIIARELAGIVKALDGTRPVTSNCNDTSPQNPLIRSGALDLIGLSYHQNEFSNFLAAYPGQTFIGSETVSALATRGHYDMPSDSMRVWPHQWDKPFTDGNKDNTCSAYDNCHVPWGSTQEETWKILKKNDFLCGGFIWTGFDYLGEPTPYGWPSRSSYFGIVDLAGFPKDSYYMYQSEWTRTPMVHISPHWNWKPGDTVDVWVYTNCEEVELFINGASVGAKKKQGDDLHLQWRTIFVPGTVKAVGRTNGKPVMAEEVKTAGPAARIMLTADRTSIAADGRDLSFVTVSVLDAQGNVVPTADNLVHFTISGGGTIAGVDNGLQTSMESFKADQRKAFNGLCLAVVQSTENAGSITLTATSDGLQQASVTIVSK